MAHARAIKQKARPQNFRLGESVVITATGSLAVNPVPVKRIDWGKGNKLPYEILAALMESGTARKCWAKIDAFLQADGFSNLDAAATKVNPIQTADELLDRISAEFAYIPAIALRVKYGTNLRPAEVYHIPINTVRKLDNGQFVVNPNMGTAQEKRTDDEILDAFNPDPVFVSSQLKKSLEEAQGIRENMKQNGQLWFIYRPLPGSPHYPVPDYWTLAGSKDIKSDTEIAVTDLDNLENNFTPSAIIGVPGDYDNTRKNENGETELDILLDNIGQLTDKENRSQAVVIPYKSKEGAVTITPWDNTKGLLSLDGKRETIANAVCRHFGVPPILVGLYKAGALGESKEIINAIALFQSEINRGQRVIQRAFEKLFPNPNANFWAISTVSVLKELPEYVINSLTEDEKRALGGFAISGNTTDKATEALKQNLNSLPEDVRAKVMDKMSAEQLLKLVNLTPDGNADN